MTNSIKETISNLATRIYGIDGFTLNIKSEYTTPYSLARSYTYSLTGKGFKTAKELVTILSAVCKARGC